MLLNTKITKEINNIFDTQVAYRIYHEHKTKKKTSKESSISLKDLLHKSFSVVKDENMEIHNEMKKNKLFWGTRPLTNKMLKYAAGDVLYLSKLFVKFLNMLNESLVAKVYDQSKQSVDYSYINLDINRFERLSLANKLREKKEIKGMLK